MEKLLNSGNMACIRAKVVVLGQSGCNWAKWLYSGKRGYTRAKWLYSGWVVVFGQYGNIRARLM